MHDVDRAGEAVPVPVPGSTPLRRSGSGGGSGSVVTHAHRGLHSGWDGSGGGDGVLVGKPGLAHMSPLVPINGTLPLGYLAQALPSALSYMHAETLAAYAPTLCHISAPLHHSSGSVSSTAGRVPSPSVWSSTSNEPSMLPQPVPPQRLPSNGLPGRRRRAVSMPRDASSRALWSQNLPVDENMDDDNDGADSSDVPMMLQLPRPGRRKRRRRSCEHDAASSVSSAASSSLLHPPGISVEALTQLRDDLTPPPDSLQFLEQRMNQLSMEHQLQLRALLIYQREREQQLRERLTQVQIAEQARLARLGRP